jgi:hypothetical protein
MLMLYIDSAVMQNMTTATRALKTAQGVLDAAHVQRATSAARLVWAQRRDRPWLALVAVPLAMNASGLMQLWWLWVPLLLGAAACTPAWRWSWVLTFQLGAIGTEWAYVGATSLGQWPSQRLVVGATWACVALYLAGGASLHRQYRDFRDRKHRR